MRKIDNRWIDGCLSRWMAIQRQIRDDELQKREGKREDRREGGREEEGWKERRNFY